MCLTKKIHSSSYAISYTFYPILYFIRITLFYILNYDESVKHKSCKHGVKWNKTDQILLLGSYKYIYK
jgi:hypothetical protein